MILFSLFGIPVFALAAFGLERWFNPAAAAPEGRAEVHPESRPEERPPFWHLLGGVLFAVPCWFLLRPLGRSGAGRSGSGNY